MIHSHLAANRVNGGVDHVKVIWLVSSLRNPLFLNVFGILKNMSPWKRLAMTVQPVTPLCISHEVFHAITAPIWSQWICTLIATFVGSYWACQVVTSEEAKGCSGMCSDILPLKTRPLDWEGHRFWLHYWTCWTYKVSHFSPKYKLCFVCSSVFSAIQRLTDTDISFWPGLLTEENSSLSYGSHFYKSWTRS